MTEKHLGVSISPSAMVDLIADWNLSKVIDHLKKKEKDKEELPDSRVYCRSSIRFLNTVIDSVSARLGMSSSQLTRCLTYHGVAILHDNNVISGLNKYLREARELAMQLNNPDIDAIIRNLVTYTPEQLDAEKTSFRVYDFNILSEIEEMSADCGVYSGQLAQIAMVRSLLTADGLENYTSVFDRLQRESRRWDAWMSYRLATLEVAVSKWVEWSRGDGVPVSLRPQT